MNVMVWVSPPPVAVKVSVEFPGGAELPTVNVSRLWFVVTVVGFREAVTPVGNPETARLTFPLNVFIGTTCKSAVATPPWTTVNPT